MATTSNASAELPDFSAPWKFSDVVLVAEDQRFHVHRNILALWSPVFEKMFTSEFQEKSKDEIPLPDKKASEINELLLLIYPNVTGKPWVTITQNNCHFLAKLAQEYQIDSIVRKCEEFLVNKMLTKEENIINELIFAQTYKLEKLVLTSVGEASNLSLRELNAHAMCDLIEPSNYKKIVEGIVQRLEKELEEAHLEHRKIKGVKEKCLKEVFELTRFLIEHAHSRPQSPRSFWSAPRIETSGRDRSRKSANHGLPALVRSLRNLNNNGYYRLQKWAAIALARDRGVGFRQKQSVLALVRHQFTSVQ